MKDLYQFNLSVLIEKNRYSNEKKLNTEIEKLFAKNHQLKEIKLVLFKKSKQNPSKLITAGNSFLQKSSISQFCLFFMLI